MCPFISYPSSTHSMAASTKSSRLFLFGVVVGVASDRPILELECSSGLQLVVFGHTRNLVVFN